MRPLGARNWIQRDTLTIHGLSSPTDNVRIFYSQQAPLFVVPQSVYPSIKGSPVAGLTNQQNWTQFGIAVAGAVAPCAVTRPIVDGFVCP
jgi:hypothetical protein